MASDQHWPGIELRRFAAPEAVVRKYSFRRAAASLGASLAPARKLTAVSK